MSKKTEQTKSELYKTRNDLSPKTRVQLINCLNETLADIVDLRSQVKHAHWNVKGMQFYSLHLLFDEISKELDDYADEIAERLVALGGTAMGTIRMAAAMTTLPDYPFEIVKGEDHVHALIDRMAPVAQSLRTGIDRCTELGDADTADLYTQVSRDVDKRLWFLEAHFQEEDEDD